MGFSLIDVHFYCILVKYFWLNLTWWESLYVERWFLHWCMAIFSTVHRVSIGPLTLLVYHDDVIKWKHIPRYWPFVRGIHGFPVNSRHKGQWRRVLTFSLICSWINGWVNNREACDLKRHRAHYDVTVMMCSCVRLNHYLCLNRRKHLQCFQLLHF